MNNFSNPLSFNHRVSKLQTQQRKQRNYQNLKSPYDGATWKNFAVTRPRNISMQNLDRMSSRTSGRGYQTTYYQPQQYEHVNGNSVMTQRRVRQQNLRLSGVTYTNKRQQHATRVKQDALRRVKLLQQKVLPLLTQQKPNDPHSQQYGLAWQLKTQQRLVKIQNSIQKVKNETQIKYQKRLMEIQRQWEERITELLEFVVSGEGQVGTMEGAGDEGVGYEEGGENINGGYERYGEMNGGYSMEVQEEMVNGNGRHA